MALRILVAAVIVFGAATASAEPVQKNANGCTVIAPAAPKVSRVARAPSAAIILELYVSVGQDLKRVRELRGQDATDDLVGRFRIIQIQRAIQSDASRQAIANELLALQQMIVKRSHVQGRAGADDSGGILRADLMLPRSTLTGTGGVSS